MLRSVTFLKEIFENKAELQDVDIPTSFLPLSRKREPCVFNFLPVKPCCRTRMQSRGLDPPHANPWQTTSRLCCGQNVCELCQEGKLAGCRGCLKFHAHGKGVDTTGSSVSETPVEEKRNPKGLGFLWSWNLSMLSQLTLPMSLVVLKEN